MNLIEIQMQSEDKTNGDKLGAPPGAAAPPTHIFLIIIIKKKKAGKCTAKLESLRMPRCWGRCLAVPHGAALHVRGLSLPAQEMAQGWLRSAGAAPAARNPQGDVG